MSASRYQLAHGDAVAWLRSLPAGSVDLLITDPPYESLEKHRAIGTTTRLKNSKASSNAWFEIFPNTRFPELFTEVHRVLKKHAHFYLYCDPETMFVAKPLAEAAGFKFWKPIIWDKCLGPDTLVWTERGTQRIADIVEGDRVALPEGGTTAVKATRRTRAHALELALSDGTTLIASREHRFVRGDGSQCEAHELAVGDALCTREVRGRIKPTLRLDDVIPAEDAVHELPATNTCLWCGDVFDGYRAAAAHQARHCDSALSKQAMAESIGITTRRLMRWMSEGRIPHAWAKQLGLESKLGERVQCSLQNDQTIWYPRELPLDYDLGKLLGLYAAEGSFQSCSGVSFAFHADEKHLHAHVARMARVLGVHAAVVIDGSVANVRIDFKIAEHLMSYFVGGRSAPTKFLKPTVYEAPDEFRRGLLAGLLEGDGHWSHDEQRETYASASPDLTMFVRRQLESLGRAPVVSRVENDHAGAWRVRFDPRNRHEALTVVSIRDLGKQDLVDVAVADRDELFLLANGVVTHNCRIGMGYHYRARYECILFFEKGKRKLNDLGVADVISEARIYNGYPAEKPPAVSEVLIRQSSEPGELVVDPFMGSGSVGVAAAALERDFAGNDLCAEAVAIARERLDEKGAVERRGEIVFTPAPQLGLAL